MLSRGTILKSDRYPSGSSEQAHRFDGLHHFRQCALDIHGCSQPTAIGLRTALALLGARPLGSSTPPSQVAWVCLRSEPIVMIYGQPFVLRDGERPYETYALSTRAENLEDIERRLVADITRESQKFGGLILVHDEEVQGVEIGQAGPLEPVFIAADAVQTVRDVFDQCVSDGYGVTLHRVPITSDQDPAAYFDLFVDICKTLPTDTPLVFNCGQGRVRTTYAMSAAVMIRRRQVMLAGEADPLGIDVRTASTPAEQQAAEGLAREREQRTRSQALLRLSALLQKTLALGDHALLTLLSAQPATLEALVDAATGRYDVVLALASCLEHGLAEKRVVDDVVDRNDVLVNLRLDPLERRLRYVSTAGTDDERSTSLQRARAALSKYFLLLSFSGCALDRPPCS